MIPLALPSPSRAALRGWRLVVLFTLALLAASAVAFLASGGGTEGLRAVIRLTARASLVLFLLSFTASSLARLAPSPATRWLIANRRPLGLSFAASHAIHLAAIIALVRADPALFWQLSTMGSVISGSTTYAVIGVMAATSSDAALRWLGPAVWRHIHLWGAWYVWLSFVFTNGKRVPMSLWYLVPVALLLAAVAARLAARLRSRR